MQTSKDNASLPLFIVFFVCWISLGIALAVFDHTASYRAKKFWHPYITIGTGVIFLTFVEFMAHGQAPILFILVIGLITFLNLRNVRFCPKCNKTARGRVWSRDKFCAKCGANLDEESRDMNQPIH